MLRISHKKTKKINFEYKIFQSSASQENDASDEVFKSAKSTFDDGNISKLNLYSLEETTSIRYLGVIINNKLNFNEHVNYISNKATKLLNLCRRNLYMCPPDVKATAYNAIVRPNLNYASACWSQHTKKNIDKIEAVQRRAARLTLNYHVYGTNAQLTQKMKSLNWLPLKHQHCIHDLQIFNKIRNNMLNISFPEIFLSST